MIASEPSVGVQRERELCECEAGLQGCWRPLSATFPLPGVAGGKGDYNKQIPLA